MDFPWLHQIFLSEPNCCHYQRAVEIRWTAVYVIWNINVKPRVTQNLLEDENFNVEIILLILREIFKIEILSYLTFINFLLLSSEKHRLLLFH